MKEELRLYSLVMYNLSPIQQGIQAAHAMAELSLSGCPLYKEWAEKWKTMIVLNGGTSRQGYHKSNPYGLGTMEQHAETLSNYGVHHACFFEPDLNYSLSAIAFILPESLYREYSKFDVLLDFVYNDTPEEERNRDISDFVRSFRLA